MSQLQVKNIISDSNESVANQKYYYLGLRTPFVGTERGERADRPASSQQGVPQD